MKVLAYVLILIVSVFGNDAKNDFDHRALSSRRHRNNHGGNYQVNDYGQNKGKYRRVVARPEYNAIEEQNERYSNTHHYKNNNGDNHKLNRHYYRQTKVQKHNKKYNGVESDTVGTNVDQPAQVAKKTDYSLHHSAGKAFEKVITHKGASFIQVHFSHFSLPRGDKIILEGETQSFQYSGHGPSGGTSDPVSGNKLLLSYRPGKHRQLSHHENQGNYGFTIDYLVTGSAKKYSAKENVCGNQPSWAPAVCFAKEAPEIYTASQAVARMMMNSTGAGTGFLIGCDGYFLTNNHNVDNQGMVSATRYEWGAECPECTDTQANNQSLGCPGKLTIEGGAKLLYTHKELDYSLLKFEDKYLPQLAQYGYLGLRPTGPVLHESIWVPQYPRAYPKQIVVRLENRKPVTITNLAVANECGKDQVGYLADTEGGSSGSPVIGFKDNLVVALHHCGGCENVAYSIDKILYDLQSQGLNIPQCLAQSTPPQNTNPQGEQPGKNDPNQQLDDQQQTQQPQHAQQQPKHHQQPQHGKHKEPQQTQHHQPQPEPQHPQNKSHKHNNLNLSNKTLTKEQPQSQGDQGKGGGTPVSVCKDATYLVEGSPCSAHGHECPKKGQPATSDCQPGAASFSNGQCVAPEDAQCVSIRDTKGCVFPSLGC
uniref:Secreted protein n=1 Tax=Thraustotheca clavata TaxID=74557 RepID=A0A0A7CLF2_9STRA|nr:secreted protein [Thraustotheca clavata]